ncbi:MAG: energy transducer TonB, partial [Acidobacteria bacterium]|nr:energy transducer TonB [Acidobacteriota bacterium]
PLHLGIINGKATSLPKPAYTREMRELCATGKVEIEVLINEKGAVLEAKVISGDELLHETFITAAKKAKFSMPFGSPTQATGIVVYNFPSEQTCPYIGVLNSKADNIPVFPLHGHVKITKESEIIVRVVIDISGNVIAAKALEGHPLLKAAATTAARHAKFYSLQNAEQTRLSGVIVYTITVDGKVEVRP